MIKFTNEKIIVLAALAICLCFTLTISSGCKKKEQSEEARQDVPAKQTKDTTTSKQIVQAGAPEKIDLHILYVGQPDTERAKDFIKFLSKNFEKVVNLDRKSFNEEKTAGFDVIVIDEIIKITREYSRPTVTIGVAGTRVGDYLDLKTGYL